MRFDRISFSGTRIAAFVGIQSAFVNVGLLKARLMAPTLVRMTGKRVPPPMLN